MNTPPRSSTMDSLRWEPEPLYLPLDDWQGGRPSRPNDHDDGSGEPGAWDDRDEWNRPGSHVIVIDLD